MTVYLDANAIIYSIEGVANLRDAVLEHVAAIDATDGVICTSRLSRLECRVRPLRDQQTDLLDAYETFFTRQHVVVADITSSVIERATELRARHNLKTPDAIHVATAIEQKADFLLTGDQSLARCPEIKVTVL